MFRAAVLALLVVFGCSHVMAQEPNQREMAERFLKIQDELKMTAGSVRMNAYRQADREKTREELVEEANAILDTVFADFKPTTRLRISLGGAVVSAWIIGIGNLPPSVLPPAISLFTVALMQGMFHLLFSPDNAIGPHEKTWEEFWEALKRSYPKMPSKYTKRKAWLLEETAESYKPHLGEVLREVHTRIAAVSECEAALMKARVELSPEQNEPTLEIESATQEQAQQRR